MINSDVNPEFLDGSVIIKINDFFFLITFIRIIFFHIGVFLRSFILTNKNCKFITDKILIICKKKKEISYKEEVRTSDDVIWHRRISKRH